jgi:hypothetical protein
MTDNTKPEGGQEQVSGELPTPRFTDASAGSATSSVDTDALVEAVLRRLEPTLDKKLQSTKDKRIAEIEKRLKMSDLTELEELGAQIPDNVKLEYRLRQIEGNRQPESNQATTSQGSGANLATQEVAEVVKKLNLDANDPEVIEKLRGTYRNRDHFEATLAQMALARATKPQPSAAESATIQAQPSTPVDVSAKIAQLQKLQREPTRNREAIAKLSAELDAVNWGG